MNIIENLLVEIDHQFSLLKCPLWNMFRLVDIFFGVRETLFPKKLVKDINNIVS
jgi:hypothetical protein